VRRDGEKRGYSEAQVLEQIDRRMPDSLRFVRPQMKFADVVLRLRDVSDEKPQLTDVELELSNALDPLKLMAAIDSLGSVESSWTPNEDLTRDRIGVVGTIDENQVRALIASLIPNAEELLVSDTQVEGGRGLQLVTVLYAISVRMRSTGASEEV
jgi:phosphoribulokinase